MYCLWMARTSCIRSMLQHTSNARSACNGMPLFAKKLTKVPLERLRALQQYSASLLRADPALEPMTALGDLGWYTMRFAVTYLGIERTANTFSVKCEGKFHPDYEGVIKRAQGVAVFVSEKKSVSPVTVETAVFLWLKRTIRCYFQVRKLTPQQFEPQQYKRHYEKLRQIAHKQGFVYCSKCS